MVRTPEESAAYWIGHDNAVMALRALAEKVGDGKTVDLKDALSAAANLIESASGDVKREWLKTLLAEEQGRLGT